MQVVQDNLAFKALEFYEKMKTRKSCRHFSKTEIDIEALKMCVLTAGTSPSGANKQPWFFSIVTSDVTKKNIRELAEKEEIDFYNNKATDEFLTDLKVFKTDWQKPHLEEAAALIVIFSKQYEMIDNVKSMSYYAKESTGIATGILITALHQLGFATLTHTPSPMKFLNEILKRPSSEKAFLILAVGNRFENGESLNLSKKNINQICEVI